MVKNYPFWAIRELLMNGCMHRDLQSNTPLRFYEFSDHLEIMNAGGLYGNARPENFPKINDYRNPIIAGAMKSLGYVNKYNRGISQVQKELRANGNPDADFDVYLLTAFAVEVKSVMANNNGDKSGLMLMQINQLFTNCSEQVKQLIISMNEGKFSVKEMQLFTDCSPKSKPLFIEKYIAPSLSLNLIAQTHPESPRHPQQKYYLTELGKEFKYYLTTRQQEEHHL